MSDKIAKKDLYIEIEKNIRGNMLNKLDMKDEEDNLKYEYAQIKQFTNKKGDIEPSQVKFAEIKSARDKFYELKKTDALEEKYNRREEYFEDMQKGEEYFPINSLESYMKKEDIKKDYSDELNEIGAKCVENEVEEIEIKAMMEIAKMKISLEEELEKEKRAKESGKDYKPKNPNKRIDIESKISQLIEEFGIKL